MRGNNTIKLGLVKEDYNAHWILDFLKVNNINVEIVTRETYNELHNLLNENKIDLMIDNVYKKNTHNIIYEFGSSQIYIAGNKNSKTILDIIDKVLYDLEEKQTDDFDKLYYKYFGEEYKLFSYKDIAIVLIFIAVALILIIFWMIPLIKKRIKVNKIKIRMHKEQYLLQYQPIYNPRNKEIIGSEGLLRLRGEDNKLIPPCDFIPEIEKNNMLFDISIWILKRAIEDYKKIEKFPCVSEKEFYVSINLYLNEIENDAFVKKIIEILSKSNLKDNKICLEIIERVKANDLDKITKNIGLLKKAGFKIAIDDFGVEYSNLDVLQKLDIDTIKVDKNFVDGIGKDIIRNEIIGFISRIALVKKRSIVLEGVEEAHQDNNIKKIIYYMYKDITIVNLCI